MAEDPSDLMLLNPVHEWDHIRGPADAPFTLVEYGDYQCPDCGRLFGTLAKCAAGIRHSSSFGVPALSTIRNS